MGNSNNSDNMNNQPYNQQSYNQQPYEQSYSNKRSTSKTILHIIKIILLVIGIIAFIVLAIGALAVYLIVKLLSSSHKVDNLKDEKVLEKLQSRYNEEFIIESSEKISDNEKTFIMHPVSDETKQFTCEVSLGHDSWYEDDYWTMLDSNMELMSKNEAAILEYFNTLDDAIEVSDITYNVSVYGSPDMSLYSIEEETVVILKYDATQYDLENTYLKFYDIYKNHIKANNNDEYGGFITYYVIMTYGDRTSKFRDTDFYISKDILDSTTNIHNIPESVIISIEETDKYKKFIDYNNWEKYTE